MEIKETLKKIKPEKKSSAEETIKKWNDYFKPYNLIVVPDALKYKSKEEKQKKTLFQKLFNNKTLKKPESVAIVYLRKNGTAQLTVAEPRNEMFNIDGRVYHQREDCNFSAGKERIPLAVIREDGLVPEGTEDYYNMESDLDMQKRCADHQDYAIKAIRHAEIVRMGYDDGSNRAKLNPKIIIAVVIGLVILYGIFKGGLV